MPAHELSSTVLADDAGAHVFRHKVASLLAPDWPVRARALANCGEAGARLDCRACGREHVNPYRCAARSCPTCAHLASAIAVEKLAARARGALEQLAELGCWEGLQPRPQRRLWRLLTLTSLPHAKTRRGLFDPAPLRRQLRRVRRAWGPFWRATSWGRRVEDVSSRARRTYRARRDTCFAMGLEVAPGGIVHLHAAVYGEYIPQPELVTRWREVLGQPVQVVDVRAMRGSDEAEFKKALREVLKYATKGDKEPGVRANRAAAIELAMRGLRRVESGGALRSTAALDSLRLIEAEAQCCASCGAAEGWKWRGMRSPAYVERNGQFGLVQRGMDADDSRRRFKGYLAHKYHGGARPAWMEEEPYELLSLPEDESAAALAFPSPAN